MPWEFDLLYTKEEHREKYLFIGGNSGAGVVVGGKQVKRGGGKWFWRQEVKLPVFQ